MPPRYASTLRCKRGIGRADHDAHVSPFTSIDRSIAGRTLVHAVSFEWADVFISDDIWQEQYSDAEAVWLEDALIQQFDNMLFNHLDPGIKEYVDEVKRQSSKKKFGILLAHGTLGHDESNDGRQSWFCVDGSHDLKLQDWIDQNGGRYFCLILASCNGAGLTPTSNRAMLLLPDRPFANWSAAFGDVSWSLIQGDKEIDKYTIEHELRALKQGRRQGQSRGHNKSHGETDQGEAEEGEGQEGEGQAHGQDEGQTQ